MTNEQAELLACVVMMLAALWAVVRITESRR